MQEVPSQPSSRAQRRRWAPSKACSKSGSNGASSLHSMAALSWPAHSPTRQWLHQRLHRSRAATLQAAAALPQCSSQRGGMSLRLKAGGRGAGRQRRRHLAPLAGAAAAGAAAFCGSCGSNPRRPAELAATWMPGHACINPRPVLRSLIRRLGAAYGTYCYLSCSGHTVRRNACSLLHLSPWLAPYADTRCQS